jgi:hypothetical protein
MPRFFFHLRRSNGPSIDDCIGIDLPDEKAARAAGERTASQLEGKTQRRGEPLGLARFDVIDEEGRLVDSVPLVMVAEL